MSYDAIAAAYNRIFGPDAAEETWAGIWPLLAPRVRPGNTVLDLCCGTGELSARLLREGLHVTGVDVSGAMLAFARQRAPQAKLERGDMRRLRVNQEFDAVVCGYNSLPHAESRRELRQVFQGVLRALRPGGTFVFDLFSARAYAAEWKGVYWRDGCEVRARFDSRRRRAECIVRSTEGEARLLTRSYTAEELRRELRQAGFGRLRHIELRRRVYWRAMAGPCWARVRTAELVS